MKIEIDRASTTKKIPQAHGSNGSKSDKASVPSNLNKPDYVRIWRFGWMLTGTMPRWANVNIKVIHSV